MVENGKKHRQNSHLIIPFPTSERVSEVSERANGRASGPVLTSGFLIILAHNALPFLSAHPPSKTLTLSKRLPLFTCRHNTNVVNA